MPDDQPTSTKLIDLAAVAVSPVLVMFMVGSLVFFLTEVGYRGEYPGRMLYTLFFFVAGCVLIARISIEQSRSYAALYALGLGMATALALVRWSMDKDIGLFVSLLLMPLIWWAADLLTWDCTHFAEDRKASGKGLLAAAGIDAPADDDPEPPKKQPEGWLERWQQYRADRAKRPHTPGVWVLYFAIAALPVFALGQSLIDPSDTARRRACFLDMAVYIGSALGLLVTTSLMGLRKYLEERGARVPTVLTLGWLGLGGGLILAFLVVGAILPRPHSETPWFGSHASNASPNRSASRNAVVRDGSAGKGQGASGTKTEKGEGKSSAKGGEQKGGNAGEKGSGGGKGQDKGGQNQEKGDSQKSDGPNQTAGQKGERKSSEAKGDQKSADGGKQEQQGEQARDADQSQQSQSEGSSASEQLGKAFEAVGSLLRWVVWLVIALAVIGAVVFFLVKGLAPFTKWAQALLDWWRSLFARKPTVVAAGGGVAPVKAVERPPPFVDFHDPFADGSAKRKSAADLTRYTFAALDSWAWDRDAGRRPDETPQEFVVRLGTEYEKLDEPGFKLAALYARVLYARGELPADAKQTLAAVWQALDGGRPARNG